MPNQKNSLRILQQKKNTKKSAITYGLFGFAGGVIFITAAGVAYVSFIKTDQSIQNIDQTEQNLIENSTESQNLLLNKQNPLVKDVDNHDLQQHDDYKTQNDNLSKAFTHQVKPDTAPKMPFDFLNQPQKATDIPTKHEKTKERKDNKQIERKKQPDIPIPPLVIKNLEIHPSEPVQAPNTLKNQINLENKEVQSTP